MNQITCRHQFLLIAPAIFMLAASTTIAQTPGHVILANGDQLPAKIVSVDQEEVDFGSPLFKEQVTLDHQLLRSIRFHPAQTASQPEDFVVRFKSGTQLEGRLLRLNEDQCQFVSTALGKVTVPVSSLLEVRRTAREVTTWSASNARELDPNLQCDSQGRMLIGAKQAFALPQPIDGTGSLEIEFLVTDQTDFQILIGENPGQPKTTVGVSNGSLIVESADDVEFGEFQSVGNIARLKLNWTIDSLHIQNQLGQSLLKLKHDGKTKAHVAFQNEGNELRIGQIAVRAKPISIVSDKLLSTQTIVWNSSASTRVSAVEIVDDQVTQTGDDDTKITYPVADLQRIWFGHSNAPPFKPATGKYACLWGQGDRVVCRQLSFANGKGEFQTKEFESTGTFTALPAEVFFLKPRNDSGKPNKSQARAKVPNASPFRLSIGGVGFSGAYSWGDAMHPIRWQFFGFTAPVTLNVARKIEITRVGRLSTTIDAEPIDRLLLKDGSMVPCQVVTADRSAFRLKSDQITTATVPAAEIRCCFFDVSDTEWRRAVTNESIQRALTLPRFSRDVQFSHVLIGRNGDLLRGTLIAIHADKIEFESRQEPLLIARKNVVGIISVASDVTTIDQTRAESRQPDVETAIAQIDCGNSFVAVGRYVSFSDKSAVIDSPVLGRLTVPADRIRQVTFNSNIDEASPLQAFTTWQLSTASEPRWEKPLPVAASANELLNKPAPEFEMPLVSTFGRNDIFRLSDHLGKIVVLNFWSTTSKPGVLGMPEYLSVLRKFSPNDVVFVAINQGEPVSQVTSFVQSKDWGTFHSIADIRSEVGTKYNVTGIPHMTIIDAQGNIRTIKVGHSRTAAVDLGNEIRGMLAE